MKSSARRVVGIVISMLLGLASRSWAQERTAFVCEGRIGNAATSPDAALRGDFEYDIGTNTAAPQQIGQFQWETGYPIGFSIVYSAQVHKAFFTLGPTITGQVPAEVFSDASGTGNLNLRVRSVLADSSVWLGNLQLTTTAGVTNLPAMVTSNNSQQLAQVIGQSLPAGFSLTGTAVFEWQSPNIPGRSLLAFQISASEWQVDLDVDTDRDGVVDDAADEVGEDQWTVARGAFMPVDQWVSGDLTNVPLAVRREWAPVILRPLGNLPTGWKVILRQEGNTNLELVCESPGALQPGPGVGESELAVGALATNALTLYVAATKDLGAFANKSNAVARLTLQVRNAAGQVMGSDSVKLQVAPIILAWNSLPLERLYVVEGNLFPSNVCSGKQQAKEWTAVWMQDYMELGSCRISTVTNLDQVVDLKHVRDDSTGFIDGRLLPEGDVAGFPRWHKSTWDNGGDGGNIEVFPPYTTTGGVKHPLGRVVLGSKHADVLGQIQAQGLQDPVMLDLEWLATAHIDEVFCFLSASQVLATDPALAWQEIIEMVNNPTAEKKIRVGRASYDDSWTNVTNDINFFFSFTRPLEHFLDVTNATLTVTDGAYQPNNYLLIDREVILVTNVTVVGNQSILGVKRGQRFGNDAQSHAVGAKIRKLSDEFVGNAYDVPSDISLHRHMEVLRTELQETLKASLVMTSVPVVFGDVYNPDHPFEYLGRYAATANMVNCVVRPAEPPITLRGTIYATNPGNARFRQLFQSMVSETVDFTQGEDDVRAWEYHRHYGELHCGSNTKRTLPSNPWWTSEEFTNWEE